MFVFLLWLLYVRLALAVCVFALCVCVCVCVCVYVCISRDLYIVLLSVPWKDWWVGLHTKLRLTPQSFSDGWHLIINVCGWAHSGPVGVFFFFFFFFFSCVLASDHQRVLCFVL